MKAVIAVPSILDFYFTPRRAAALGARVLERELSGYGWNTGIMNLPLLRQPANERLPECLDYLQKYIIEKEKGPVSWFTGYRRFGPDHQTASKLIVSEHPDIVCLSSFAWGYAEESRDLATAIAMEMPETPIIIGGHGPTALPDYFLRLRHPVNTDRPLFSLVVAGEIEKSAGELTEALINSGRFLDLRLNEPAADFMPVAGMSGDFRGRRRISAVFTRGCPRHCRFCSNHICHGRKFRVSDFRLWPENISEAAGDYTSIDLNIEDDNILYRKKDFFQFLEIMKKRYPEMMFLAENGLDYMLLEKTDIRRLKESGFIRLNLSLAVLSKETGLIERRESDPEKLSSLILAAAEVGLPVTTHFISGLSGDNADDIVRTLQFLDRLPTQIGISNFYPVPGLPGFTDPSPFLDSAPRLALGSSVFPWTGSMTTRQMITAFRLARWSNYRKQMKSGDELGTKIIRSGRLHTFAGDRAEVAIVAVPELDNDMARSFIRCP